MKRRPDIASLERQVMMIDDDELRDALLGLIEVLKAHESALGWVMTYAEGVR